MDIKNTVGGNYRSEKLIAYAEEEFCGYMLKYMLYSESTDDGTEIFRVTVESYSDMHEIATVTVGTGLKWASDFFSLISENQLMPCTLEEVYEDYLVGATISV